MQRWLARYRAGGLAGLGRATRADRGRSSFPESLRLLVEGLTLRTPVPSAAQVHRQVAAVAEREGWPVPSYSSVYAIIRGIDPALRTLAVEGTKRYAEMFELVYRRQAGRPNEIWQADHTQLDLWVVTPAGSPARPWLTVIEDDHSRAIAGYAVNLGPPSALQTALALRQAIWRKADPAWHVCGIPAVFHTDHGSDFTSRHMEQVAADLGMRLVFSLPGQPRGRGKVERYLDTVNQMCLSALPGYAPRGTRDRAALARLTLAELDAALGEFIVKVYNHRVHGETGKPPQARWEAGGFLPHLPESPEQLDLLLLTVAKPRKVHPDGIHFQGLRYLDPVLAAYVGEPVTIRYDPRDLAEIRVFHRDRFLTRAICPDLAAATVSLKEITAARTARRRELRRQIGERASVVDRLIAVHAPPPPGPPGPPAEAAVTAEGQPEPLPKLKRYGRSKPDMATQGEKPGQPGALTKTAPRDAGAAGREPPPDANFIVTKEYRRFTEFADAVRRERYIGLCYGQPGVGKTLSVRRYACWHELGPLLQASRHHFTEGRDRADWHTLLYTPTVSVTSRMVDKELTQLGSAFAVVRTPYPFDPRARASAHALPPFVELLIIDEADRLRTAALEQLRDHYDRSQLGMILVGMPGIEKRLARYPQLYSRIGFVHEYRTLSSEELVFVLQHHWSKLNLTLAADDFTDAEAIAAVARITGGNFRLVQRLFAQIQRIMEINNLATITREVVETARESLVIGIL